MERTFQFLVKGFLTYVFPCQFLEAFSSIPANHHLPNRKRTLCPLKSCVCLAGSKSVAFVQHIVSWHFVEEPRLPSGKVDLFWVWWEEKNEESLPCGLIAPEPAQPWVPRRAREPPAMQTRPGSLALGTHSHFYQGPSCFHAALRLLSMQINSFQGGRD